MLKDSDIFRAWLTLQTFLWMALFSSQVMAGEAINLRHSFAGNLSFEITAGSFRRSSNDNNPCRTRNTSTQRLPSLPAGSTIKHAYLYWGATYNNTPDSTVTLNGSTVTADRLYTESKDSYRFFSGISDVTTIVANNGSGRNYSVSGLSIYKPNDWCNSQVVFAGWALVVIYEDSNEPLNVLNIFDGFQYYQNSSILLVPDNFQLSNTPTGKHAHITWEGDDTINSSNENLRFEGFNLVDADNPLNEQFNSRSNILGGITTYGVDVDYYDISPYLTPGSTSVTTYYESGQDLVLLSAEIISVSNVEVADLSIAANSPASWPVGQIVDQSFIISNNGPTDEEGGVSFTTTLPNELIYQGHTSAGWSCNTSGQILNCSNSNNIANGSSTTLSLQLLVNDTTANSANITATITHNKFDNISSNNSVTIGSPLARANLSSSSKTVIDLDGGTVEPGDVLRYIITLNETAGIAASNISVTDHIPAQSSGYTVVSFPSGAHNNSQLPPAGNNNAGLVSIDQISVAANASVSILIDVTIDASTPSGTTISNSASISGNNISISVSSNDVIVDDAVSGAQGNKPLYLYGNQTLSRNPATGTQSDVELVDSASLNWNITPTLASELTLNAGNIPVNLFLRNGFDGNDNNEYTHNITATLSYAGNVIGSGVQSASLVNTNVRSATINISLSTAVTIPSGSSLTLTLSQTGSQYGDPVDVIALSNGNNSQVILNSATVINVENIEVWSKPYGTSGETKLTDSEVDTTVYLRSTVSDPFGSFDITNAVIEVTTSEGNVFSLPSSQMTEVFDSGLEHKIYETELVLDENQPNGYWTFSVTGEEGTEGTVTHTRLNSFWFKPFMPSITLEKTVTAIYDPINLSNNPKAIPGSILQYQIHAQNSGRGKSDANSTFLNDRIPDNSDFYVGDLNGSIGPVRFTDGASPNESGLNYQFIELSHSSDDLSFSIDGSDFSYTPIPDADGYDPAVRYIRLNPKGEFNASDKNITFQPEFTIEYQIRLN